MTTSDYRQAVIHRGTRWRVAWIPAALAIVGKFVKIHDEDGWKVAWVGRKMDGAWVRDRSNDHRYQRRVSDV